MVTHLSSNDWNGDDPWMWKPEARNSSPIIFTFMSSWDSSPKCRHRGEGGGQGVTERENPLRWRISLVTRWKLSKMPPPPGRRDKGRRRREGGEQGVAVWENLLRRRILRRYSLGCCRGGQGVRDGESKPTTVAGDVALLLGESTGKIVAFEDPFLISGWAMIRLSCHCRRVYRYTSMRICIFHKLSVCGNASG